LMGAGSRVTLDMGGPVKIEVEEATLDTYIEQGGAIEADGGRVYLTAKAAGDLAASVINHTGVTQARTLAENEQGEVWLMGDMDNGETQVAGTLDASAPEGGDGGFVETSAAKVRIADEASVTTRAEDGVTGEWLIDPQDYTVAAEDGDITGTQLSDGLANNNVTIESVEGAEEGNGDIFVNDEVTWNSGNTLTLDAQRDIEINDPVTATGDNAGLELNFGGSDYYVNAPVTLSGTNASLNINSNAYTLIHSMEELGDIDTTTGGDHRYALAKDLDASGNIYDDALVATFTGTFTGLGHDIRNLTIFTTSRRSGLFGLINSGSVVRDIGLVDGNVASTNDNAGALAGTNIGRVNNAYASVTVKGETYVGGLIGLNNGIIKNAHATGNVEGSNSSVGGLVGQNNNGSISDAYATGSVSGSFSQGGGLVGFNDIGNTITNAYATGNVNGTGNIIGGLVGENQGTITNAYASGTATGSSGIGGLVGANNIDGTTDNSFYATTDTNGDAIDDEYTNTTGTGKTLVEMQEASTFTDAGWDETVWSFGAGADLAGYGISRPYLTSVTPDEDIPDQIPLFNNGFGTENQPFALTDWQQLQNINHNADVLTGGYRFVLVNVLNDNTEGYSQQASDAANNNEGWNPIGDYSARFKGTFDGSGNDIKGLVISRDEDYQGLFGSTEEAIIANVSLSDISVDSSGNIVGGLVAYSNESEINDASVSGSVSGGLSIGGLVGFNAYSDINNSKANVAVDAERNAGGLVGFNNNGTVETSYAVGTVQGYDAAGGLIGLDNKGVVDGAYATVSVKGSDRIGGLIGYSNEGDINRTYSNGSVEAANSAGGLIGRSDGLNVVSSYWNSESSGQMSSAGGQPKTTSELMDPDTFTDAGWDLSEQGAEDTTWRIYEGNTAPLLRSLLTPLTVSPDNINTVYNGQDQTSTGEWSADQAYEPEHLKGDATSSGGGTDVGSYALELTGLYSGQQGYDLSLEEGALTIKKAEATVTANSDTVTYDGTEQILNGYSVSGLVNDEAGIEFVITGVSGTDAGSYTHTAGGSDKNYNLTFEEGELTIDPRAITVAADDQQKTEGRTDPEFTWQITQGNLVADDALKGDLARGIGEQPGTYTIEQGELTESTNPNYAIDFLEGELTIAEDPTTAETRDRPNTDSVINNVLATTANLQPQPTFSNSQLPVQVVGTGIRV
ncbi:MAG: hypothetical protein LC687_05820, partial [Actinobacteria bacterium]|nr:hypothetical protein [Actinomycetota bacterium]